VDADFDAASLHEVDDVPREVEMSQLSGEVEHLVVGLRRGGESVERGGPVEEREGLEEGDAVADGAAFLDDAAGDGGGGFLSGGERGEVEGEVGDAEVGSGGSGVRVWCGVSAVVIFDGGVEFVG